MRGRTKQPPPGEFIWKEEAHALTLGGETVLTVRLRWPEPVMPGLGPRRLVRYYAQVARLWRRRWTRTLYLLAGLDLAEKREASRPFQPWTAQLDGSWELLPGGLWSVCLDAREVRGDGRATVARQCDLWRLYEGAPVPPAALLSGRASRRQLLAQAAAAAQARHQDSALFLRQDWQEQLKTVCRPRRLELTPDGLTLHCPQCTISPGAEGVVALPLGWCAPANPALRPPQAPQQA